MKVLITGATGYLGQTLINYLIKREVSVLACTRPNSEKLLNRCVEKVEYSFEKHENLKIPSDVDVVVHMAAKTGLVPVEDINSNLEVDAAIELYKKCLKSNSRLIFISSLSAQKNINTYYAQTKCKIEEYLRDKKEVSIIRLGLVYGGKPNGLYKTLMFLSERLPIIPIFKPTPTVQLSYIDQVCEGIFLTFKLTGFREYNIITNDISFDQFLKEISFFKNAKNVRFIYIPKFLSLLCCKCVNKFEITKFGIDRYIALSFGYKKFTNNHEKTEGTRSSLIESDTIQKSLVENEAIAILSHVMGYKPSKALIQRYIEATDKKSLNLAESLVESPWKIGFYDNLLYKNILLRERLIVASSIVESSPEGFMVFNYKGNDKIFSNLLYGISILAKESVFTAASPIYRFFGDSNPIRESSYHV